MERMRKSSSGSRSSTNPVRISLVDRDDRNATRTDPRKSQISKSRARSSSSDGSQIPRPRIRSSSIDASSRKSHLKPPGKTSLSQHGSTTPKTPVVDHRSTLTLPSGSTTRGRSPSAERASSIGVKPPRKEVRPLNEKSFQNLMLNKIDSYFHAIEQSAMLNPSGSLKPITLKMFVDATNLLLKLLDIKQALSMVNYVEELPKIAKKLFYPGVVAKSWLKTANAMHSWPQVLGWLCWLVEICEAKDLVNDTFSIDNLPFINYDGQGEGKREHLKYMLKAYIAWNTENLDQEAALIDEYLQKVSEQQGVSEEDLAVAQLELEREEEKLHVADERTKDVDSKVKNLEEMLQTLKEDEAKQDAYLKEKEEYIRSVQVQTEQIDDDYGAMCSEIQKLKNRKDELVKIIEEQPMSVVERDDIVKKCADIQNYMQVLENHLGELEKEVYSLDIKLATMKRGLSKAVLAYNKDIFMNLDRDMGVDLEELKMPETGILAAGIMEELREKANLMNDLKERLKRMVYEKDALIAEDDNKYQALQEKLASLEEEKREFVVKLNDKKNSLNDIKEHAKAEETRLKEAIKALQSEMKELQESVPNTEAARGELAEAKDKLEALERRKNHLEKAADSFFGKFFQILAEHRKELAAALKELKKNDT